MVELFSCAKGTNQDERAAWLTDLELPPDLPRVLLATCDRVELYLGEGELTLACVEHLFCVAAGLDSPLLGENAILGQIKRAYAQACEEGRVGKSLHRLFQAALRVGKLVRTRTGLNKGAVSHSQAVLQILQRFCPWWKDLSYLVVGINPMTVDVLRYLKKAGAGILMLSSRNLVKAQTVGAQLDIPVSPFESLSEALLDHSVVVCASAAPHLLIPAERVPKDGRERWFFDLAQPRDVDPSLAAFPGVQLWDLDRIEALVNQNLEGRQREIAQARLIVHTEAERFMHDQSRQPFQSLGQSSNRRIPGELSFALS